MTSIFDLTQLVAQNIWLYGGAFLLVLSILVFIHEWGHYIVARKCGVRVESFSIGFGKELFGWTNKAGTRWKISMIPLGGYVKMFGDADPASAGTTENVTDQATQAVRVMSDSERKEAFFSQSVAKRMAIVFAGPAINFIFAVVVLAGLYVAYGQPVTPSIGAAVIVGSAADEAGFKPHDEVLAIDGRAMRRFEDIRNEVMIGLGAPRTVTIRRDGQEMTIRVAPKVEEVEDHFGFKHSRGLLGLISPSNGVDLGGIVDINGTDVKDANAAEKRDMLRPLMDTTFTIALKSGDKDGAKTLTVHPMAAMNKWDDPADAKISALILSDRDAEIVIPHGVVSATAEAIHDTGDIVSGTLQALGQIVSGTRSTRELGGIIRIGAMAGDMAKLGIVQLITFTALLSINLGLINLFPIPMLDGGHLLFYTIEALRGKAISEQIQEYAFRLGMVFLVAVMVFSNLNDIMQLIL